MDWFLGDFSYTLTARMSPAAFGQWMASLGMVPCVAVEDHGLFCRPGATADPMGAEQGAVGEYEDGLAEYSAWSS